MSMTARLWSISALAVELSMDRRTVATKLRSVRPDGKLNGSSAWHLTTALSALRGGKGGPVSASPVAPVPPPFKGVDHVERDFDRGFAVAHLMTVYHLERWVASIAAGIGVPMAQAHQIAGGVAYTAMNETAEMARQLNLEPWTGEPDPDLYNLDSFAPINWPRLAANAGEPDWTPPAYTSAWPEYSPEEHAANAGPVT